MKDTGEALIELGITPEIKGFWYIIDMIEEIRKGSTSKIVTMYTTVGKKNNTTWQKVERGIRHAIENRLDMTQEAYKKYLSTYPEKLPNRAFLFTLEYKLKNMGD